MDKKNKNLLEKFTIKERKKINNFFIKEENIEIINKLEEQRNSLSKKIVIYFFKNTVILFILSLFVSSFILYKIGVSLEENKVIIFLGTNLSILLLIGFPFFLFTKSNIDDIKKDIYSRNNIKNSLLPKFIKIINKDLFYDEGDKYFNFDLEELKGSGITNIFNYKTIEDSISYVFGRERKNGKKAISLNGGEIKKITSSHDKEYDAKYAINSSYIIKIKFIECKNFIKNPISIISKKSTKIIEKIIVIIMTWFTPIAIVEELGLYFIELIGNFFILYTILSVLIGYFLGTKILLKNIVKMDSSEFEKKFDIKCEEPLESRKLLTPAFMQRILDYVNKFSNNRNYEFYFVNNIFYIKFNTKGNFLEFSNKKTIKENVKNFLNFYLEIKNIISLAEDLNLEYYDKA